MKLDSSRAADIALDRVCRNHEVSELAESFLPVAGSASPPPHTTDIRQRPLPPISRIPCILLPHTVSHEVHNSRTQRAVSSQGANELLHHLRGRQRTHLPPP